MDRAIEVLLAVERWAERGAIADTKVAATKRTHRFSTRFMPLIKR